MPKAGKKLYAVQAGRAPGVYETWYVAILISSSTLVNLT